MPPVNNVWANTAPLSIGENRTLPSGQTCVARHLGIEDLVAAGILEHADSLTSLVDEKHVRKVRGGRGPDRDQVNMQSVMKDANALRSILTVADKAIPIIVLDPVVKLHYVSTDNGTRMLGVDEREPGVVYTDQIGLADKMDLFSWAMGDVEGLQSFRNTEAGPDVGAVSTGGQVSRPTKRTARPRRT